MPEKPTSRRAAHSTTPAAIAPDWEISASDPARGSRSAKLALRAPGGERTPRQFGPTILRPLARARARMASPGESGPWPSPAVRTMAVCAPLAQASSMMPGVIAAGVATTTRSTGTPMADSEGRQATPSTSACLGLTAKSAPLKPPAFNPRNTTPPREPGRGLAPTTATEEGRSSRSSR